MLCKNCAHFRTHIPFAGMIESNHRCGRRKGWNAVGGEFTIDVDAFVERRKPGLIFGRDRCGPEGRYFDQERPAGPPKGGPGGRK
jgi:hypothetical protein